MLNHVNCDMIKYTARTYQFLKDQWPVRCLVHLLGGRPVLFQLSKQYITDLEPIIDVSVFFFSVCLFFYYSLMCSDFLRLLSCCNMENVGMWCASAFKKIPGLVGCIEAVVT